MVRHEEIVAFSKSTINYFPLMVKNEHSSPKRIVNVTSISSHISKARKTKADVAGTFYTHHYPQSILAFGKNKGESRNYRHPTRKPVSLLRYIIETYTKQNDTVLDCFAGIASTGAACVETNRHFIGIEIDEDYWKIGRNRLLDYEKADDSQP